jgi:eukaryotic-like serine/threonine-protein kinase
MAAALVGTVLDGRYRIIKLIGEGGMGEVYSAEHVHIDKKFAIKLLKTEIVSNQEAVTRFRQEARSSSSIGHRNIIGIDDFGQLADGRIYMCMELLNGAALNDMIQQPMSADRLLNILIQTGHGLAAAHAKGIIHRDMKPENIFVTIGAQGEDIPKILDFGIAKVAGNEGGNHLTRTGTIFGTPFYMAPEQALGNPVDARTDIYAMGVIMYECFAGSLPFQGESFMGILTQHITSEPEPVISRAQKAGRQLPPGLADIITRCMQKNPAQRYGSMDELVNALIAIYRGVAGPGMSTYMEAFPTGSAHSSQPTPPPYGHQGYNNPTIAAPSGPQLMQPMATPMPMPAQQSQPVMHPGLYDPSASVLSVPKKSNMGLIIGILIVLLAGGGIAAFVVLNNNKDDKNQGGGGSGSSVIATANDGSDTKGSAAVKVPDKGSDATVTPPPVVPDAGTTVIPTNTTGSAGSASNPDLRHPVNVVIDSNAPGFQVFDKGVPDEDNIVPVLPGDKLVLTVKAKGYKEATVTIDGSKERVRVHLDLEKKTTTTVIVPPINTNPPHTGSGSAAPHNNPPPPQTMDCSKSVVDPNSSTCRRQYCKSHPDDIGRGCTTD